VVCENFTDYSKLTQETYTMVLHAPSIIWGLDDDGPELYCD